jgi:dTDP-4-dehydrorhamnose reductase
MEAILIFGDTPLAHRLAFYLREYARVKSLDVAVHQQKLDSKTTMASVQKSTWGIYVEGSVASRPDLVINAHETASLALCGTDPQLAWRDNALHASFIAYAARTADVPLIQMSTDHVFRGDRGPYGIGDARNPINVYGVTKWYAEMVCHTLYPNSEKLEAGAPTKGTTIVRTSSLYGYEVDSPPRKYTKIKDGEVIHEGVIHDGSLSSPSFIGEVAFLIARNILLSPASLNQGIIHCAPALGCVSWATYMHDLGWPLVADREGPGRRAVGVDRQGEKRGLIPTSGWFLPAAPKKSWEAFRDEYESGGSYVKFWNPDHGEWRERL